MTINEKMAKLRERMARLDALHGTELTHEAVEVAQGILDAAQEELRRQSTKKELTIVHTVEVTMISHEPDEEAANAFIELIKRDPAGVGKIIRLLLGMDDAKVTGVKIFVRDE